MFVSKKIKRRIRLKINRVIFSGKLIYKMFFGNNIRLLYTMGMVSLTIFFYIFFCDPINIAERQLNIKVITSNVIKKNNIQNELSKMETNQFLNNSILLNKKVESIAILNIDGKNYGLSVKVVGVDKDNIYFTHKQKMYKSYINNINIQFHEIRSIDDFVNKTIVCLALYLSSLLMLIVFWSTIKNLVLSLTTPVYRIKKYNYLKKYFTFYDIIDCVMISDKIYLYFALFNLEFIVICYYEVGQGFNNYFLFDISLLCANVLLIVTFIYMAIAGSENIIDYTFNNSKYTSDIALLTENRELSANNVVNKISLDDLKLMKKIAELEDSQENSIRNVLINNSYIFQRINNPQNNILISKLINLKMIGYISIGNVINLTSSGREAIELPKELYLFRVPYEFELKFVNALNSFKEGNPQKCMNICSVEILEGFIKWAITKLVTSEDELKKLCIENISRSPHTLAIATLGDLEKILFLIIKFRYSFNSNSIKQMTGIMVACKNIRNSISHDQAKSELNIKSSDYILAYDYYHLCRIFVNILYQKMAN